ncbi:MAG: glycyl-radical enzyme activating protein [Proteobacteria bacterium]|nr:glycyl-radical enzyme activating protein [Pseudomonadota bacterium]
MMMNDVSTLQDISWNTQQEEKRAREQTGMPRGTLFEIQRMSTEDGPGIRTTVFLKGCSLKCSWCHNPESVSPHPQVQWIGSRCIGCRTCLEVCIHKAISFRPDGVSIDRKACQGCGSCAEECPSTALELVGKTWMTDDLIREVLKDRAFFETSGGGITLSGGEPTLQTGFARALLKGLVAEGIDTALDTCGMCKEETLAQLIPYTRLILYDIKEIDPEKHREFTGSSNEQILRNLLYVCDYMKTQDDLKLWIRTPVIPGATAREENIRGISRFIASNLGDLVSRWELCTFNNLCRDKYIRLDLDWDFKEAELLDRSLIAGLADVAKNSGVDPDIVHWTGETKD